MQHVQLGPTGSCIPDGICVTTLHHTNVPADASMNRCARGQLGDARWTWQIRCRSGCTAAGGVMASRCEGLWITTARRIRKMSSGIIGELRKTFVPIEPGREKAASTSKDIDVQKCRMGRTLYCHTSRPRTIRSPG